MKNRILLAGLLFLLGPAAGCDRLSGSPSPDALAAEPAAGKAPGTGAAAVAAPAPAAAAPAPAPPPPAGAKEALDKAAALAQAGQREQARLAYSRALHLCPDCLEGQRDLVELLLEDSSPADAAAFLRDRLESTGRSAGPLFGLAYVLARGGTLEGMREAAQLLEEARVARPDQTMLLLTLAEVHAALDDRSRAAALYGQAIAALRATGDWDGEAQANIRRAQLLHMQGDPQARAAYEEAIARAVSRKDAGQEALARNGLGGLLFTLGEVEAALASFTAALAAADRGSDLKGAAAALQNLSMVHEELWQDRQALDRLDELVNRLDRASKPAEAAQARLQAGLLMGRVGLLQEAVGSLQAALEAFQKLDAWGSVADTLVALGRVFRQNGRSKDALHVLGQALEVRQTLASLIEDYRPVAEVLLELGPLEAETGGKEAVAHLEQALELARKAGEKEMIASAARALGFALLRQGKLDGIPPLLAEMAGAGEDEPFLAAQLAAAADETDEAIELGEAAVDPARRLALDELMERYGFLLHLYLQRSRGAADLRRAFGVAVAGRAARSLQQRQQMRVRVERGIDQDRLWEELRLAAQEEGMTRLIAGAASDEVEQVWRTRREELRRQMAAWRARTVQDAPAWALLHFPEAVRRVAEELALPSGEVHIHPVLSSAGATIFLLDGATLEAVSIKGTPGKEALRKEILELVRTRFSGARRVVLSPPPGAQDMDWGLPLAPSPVVPVLAAAASAAGASQEEAGTGAAAASSGTGQVAGGAAPLLPAVETMELLAPLKPVFDSALTGRDVEVRLTAQQLKKGAGEAVELLARAALYSGAQEVRFLLPKGEKLVYTAR